MLLLIIALIKIIISIHPSLCYHPKDNCSFDYDGNCKNILSGQIGWIGARKEKAQAFILLLGALEIRAP